MSANDVSADQRLPEHMRRQGRMSSLLEFQQRALAIEEDKSQSVRGDLYVDLEVASRSISQVSSNWTDQMLKPLGRRRSTMSLFGIPVGDSVGYYHRHLKVLVFLILLGGIGGPLSSGIRELSGYLKRLRVSSTDQVSSPWLQYLVWTAQVVACTQMAVLWTRIGPSACGSGISQMKSILTGIDPRMYLPGYFDASTLVAKLGGLVFALSSGLVVGMEGAFVHIMSIITHHLLQLPFFSHFSDKLHARLQLLAAACAVGVSSTFSSPIGGVLFSLEVTSTYYLMSNYMKAFISSVAGSLTLQLTFANAFAQERQTSMMKVEMPEQAFDMWEIPLFIVLGAIIGVFTTIMVSFVRVIARERRALRDSRETWRRVYAMWIDPLLVAVLVATVTSWPGKFMRCHSIDELSVLFWDDLPAEWNSTMSVFVSLAMFAATYIVFLPICITLPIPTGVWLPTFAAGAAVGRFCGEALRNWSPFQGISPGAYALAGAAAFTGAATRTVSAAVITLELVGSMTLMLPLFCAVLAAIGVSNMLPEESVYDTLLFVSKMPYLPQEDFDPVSVVGDVVAPALVYVTKHTTVLKLLLAIHRMPDQDIPVVRSDDSMQLLGVVSVDDLRRLVRFFYLKHKIMDADADLAGALNEPSSGRFSLSKFAARFHSGSGGLYGTKSYDLAYNSLTAKMLPAGEDSAKQAVPIILDDEKMIALMTSEWSQTKKDMLNTPIKLSLGKICVLKPLAITVASETPLADLHVIFTMLRFDHVYVCEQGTLLGVVTTKALLEAGKTKQRTHGRIRWGQKRSSRVDG